MTSANSSQDNEVKFFLENKTMGERFKFYMDKLLKEINVQNSEVEILKTKIDVKESQISKLEKEIYFRNMNNTKTVIGSINENQSHNELKMLSESKIFNTVVKSDITKSIGKKRRYEEPSQEDKENFNFSKNKMDIDNGITNSMKGDKNGINSNSIFKILKTSAVPFNLTSSETKKIPKII